MAKKQKLMDRSPPLSNSRRASLPKVPTVTSMRMRRHQSRERGSGPTGRWARLRYSTNIPGLATICLVLAVWEVVARWLDEEILLVPATAVAADLVTWLVEDDMIGDLQTSGKEFAIGYGLAALVGIAAGFAIALSPLLDRATRPLVSAAYSSPLLALTPLFITWFGLGLTSKIALLFLIGFFPVLINTSVGVKQVEKNMLDVAKAFGANRRQIVTAVQLPSAVPYIIAGLNIAVARSMTGIFVVELFGAQSGVGVEISSASSLFRTDRMLAGIVVLAGSGVLFSSILTKIEKRASRGRAIAAR